MSKQKKKEPEIIAQWELENVGIYTNVGIQYTDLTIKLYKRYISHRDITLYERVILGIKDFFYRVDVIPHNPIRENRDKDYLPPYSENGNDAVSEFSFSLGLIKGNDIPDISVKNINRLVCEQLKEYDPNYKEERYKANKDKKKPWTSRMLFEKTIGRYKKDYGYDGTMKIGAFTNIYPFQGDHLSGHTTWLGAKIECDDENGWIFEVVLYGVYFYISSRPLYRLTQKLFVKHRPKWDRGVTWDTYYPILKQWRKEYPIEYFFNTDWYFKVGINRAWGFYFNKEFDNSSRGVRYLNPWRNKLWNLI